MSDKLYKPAFGWMEMDKSYQIAEARLRFEVDASLPQKPEIILFNIAPQLHKGIENLQKFRQWRLIETVPRKRDFGGRQACCDQMKQPYGTTLKIVLEPSSFQGDTDDAQNFGTLGDPDKRFFVDGKVDWIAKLHFWQPVLALNKAKQKEESAAVMAEGFLKWDDRPDMWPVLRKRFEQNGN